MMKKVAVLGAAGGIGQPLSLLLKASPLGRISQLNLFDVVNTPGVASDLSHCNTSASVKGFVGMPQLSEALKGMDVVVIPAGVPRKPGMSRDDLFDTNASIVQSLAKECAKVCPEAMMLIIANPVNSTVPIVAETFKQANVYDEKRLFGVTTLDVVRSSMMAAEILKIDPKDLNVNVIGGHAGTTILPLLSQVKGLEHLSEDELKALTKRIQFGGDEVVQAKDGAGSATLSMAYAGAMFTNQLLDAMCGVNGIVECCYTQNEVAKDLNFFSTPTLLGPNGAEVIHPYGSLSSLEQENLDQMSPDLKKQIEKGEAFAKSNM